VTAWRGSAVSAGGTHHVVGEVPLYAARFLEVLKFHEPGLAPARDASGAYHIDEAGSPAYAARFVRTFGFYEGLASVQGEGGWFHIRPDGAAAYPERYAWCGNYQGGRCAVRDRDGRYLHLEERGRAAYVDRFRYAGDFRDGYAVVQRDDGLHTHINRSGLPVHGRWFIDLDVFHKGFARARDARGYFHVDAKGEPAHPRRFAAVEPFYNGQARVERLDGGLEIIDERGEATLELRSPILPRVDGAGIARVGDRYRLEGVLARSAWGSVWTATDERTGAGVVVKSARGGHRREVEVLSRLGASAHVPALLDVVEGGDTGWLVLERRPGLPLGDRSHCAPLPPAEAVGVILRVLDVVGALHRRGFAHTDLHPGNVLLDREVGPASVCVLDYARAAPLDSSGGWWGEINWGQWEVAPPEQLADFARLDRSADTYAAAALLIYLLTGRACFRVDVRRLRQDGWDAVRAAFVRSKLHPIDLDGVPEPMRPALSRALDPRPERRFTDAEALTKALSPWSSHV
jgi:hypothetical protein